MDKTSDSDSDAAGSIPARRSKKMSVVASFFYSEIKYENFS